MQRPSSSSTGSSSGRVVTFSSIAGVVSLTILVISQIICVDIAASWAIGEWLGMHGTPEYIFGAVMLLPALAMSAWFARLAWDAETSPENNV